MIKHILGVVAVLMVAGCQTVGGGQATKAASVNDAIQVAKAQQRVMDIILSICIEGYGAGQADETIRQTEGAVKVDLEGYPDGSMSYAVDISPASYAIVTLQGRNGACTVSAPLSEAPDIESLDAGVGGVRDLYSDQGLRQLFLKKHNLMALVQDGKMYGTGELRRFVVLSNKEDWDKMLADFEQQGRVPPKEFYIHAWLR